MPNVPPAIESGVLPGYDVTTWYGVFGPPGVPAAIVARLNTTLNSIISDAKVRDRLTTFLHPLIGGVDGTGWDFGQPVYQSQLATLLEATEGVVTPIDPLR